jgi:AcrR family transcriptional regulator
VPATPTTTRRRAAALPPDERRAMIVEATIPLVIEHGELVTTRQIADAAGIAEGTIFRAFADKDELLTAVIDAALDPEPLERAFAEIDPGLPLADIVVRASEVAQQRVVDIWRLATGVGPRFHDHTKRPMADSPALTRLLTTHRIHLRYPPREAARMLRAIVFATSHPMMVERPTPPSEIAQLFLHGASTGTGGERGSC